ncbi:D-alanyl-D-alanine carboxypeptidase family protein [Spirochaeta africana]|nr:serine hydrolase [Spirochaeta africana]
MQKHPRFTAVMMFAVVVLFAGSLSGYAAAPDDWADSAFLPPSVPESLDAAAAAVLLDAETGAVLYAHNRDEVMPPASLVKLIVMNALLDEVAEGRLGLYQDIPIPPEAWAQNAPPRSSLMFLGPGQRVSLHELLLGLAIPSGNDAAVAAALLLEDSVPAFVERVNRDLADRGYRYTRLVEPSGYSRDNTTTAEEFARFARSYVLRHPEAIERYHAVRQFGYPQLENLLHGNNEHVIMQQNYNRLLWIMPEADGLKTGTIPSVGFNLAATARRDGRRLIAVVLGVQADTPQEGNNLRAEVSRDLLEYGFREFTAAEPRLPDPGMVRLYGASQPQLPLYIDAPWARQATEGGPVPIMVPVELAGSIQAEYEIHRRIRGAVPAGAVLGRIVFTAGGQEVFQAPIRAGDSAAAGRWWQRLRDWFRLLWERLQGQPWPALLYDLSI